LTKIMLDYVPPKSIHTAIDQPFCLMLHLKGFLFNLVLYCHNHIITNIPSHRTRQICLRWLMGVDLGEGCATLMGLRLYTKGQITIGAHSVIDRDCTLDGRGGITIGTNVNLAPEVMVLTAYHDPDSDDFAGIEKAVVIEDYVWIATRAVILPGVKIGHGAVVGAGSVVTKDVPPRTIVAGNPAKVIRQRQGNQTYQLDYKRRFH
jgi:acetyltransferase-like isoleucine patch superfamily enzyme